MSLEGTRALLASHKTGSAMRALSALIDVVEQQEKRIAEQQEQIKNLREAVHQQAEKLAGQTAALGRRIQKLEGVHGA